MALHAAPQPIDIHTCVRTQPPMQIHKRNSANSQFLPSPLTTGYHTPIQHWKTQPTNTQSTTTLRRHTIPLLPLNIALLNIRKLSRFAGILRKIWYTWTRVHVLYCSPNRTRRLRKGTPHGFTARCHNCPGLTKNPKILLTGANTICKHHLLTPQTITTSHSKQ
jgi:hypothetical protein